MFDKLGLEGMYFYIIEAICEHLTTNIFSDEKLKVFPLRLGVKQGCPLLTFCIKCRKCYPEQVGKEKKKKNPKCEERSKIVCF